MTACGYDIMFDRERLRMRSMLSWLGLISRVMIALVRQHLRTKTVHVPRSANICSALLQSPTRLVKGISNFS